MRCDARARRRRRRRRRARGAGCCHCFATRPARLSGQRSPMTAARFHVAIVGLRSENSSFSPHQTRLEDFHTLRQSSLLRAHYKAHLCAGAGQRLGLNNSHPPLGEIGTSTPYVRCLAPSVRACCCVEHQTNECLKICPLRAWIRRY